MLKLETLGVVIVIALAVVVGIVLRSRTSGASETEKADETLISLVALLPEPMTLSEEMVRSRLEGAFDLKFGDTPDDENIITEFRPGFMGVQFGERRFGIMSIPHRYSDNPPDIETKDTRIRLAMKNHKAWLAVDAVGQVPEDQKEETYRLIGKMLAAMLEDGALAIYGTESQRMMYFHPETINLLQSDDPQSALEFSDPPVINVDGEDPRMAAAVEEARRRWPEFVAAFEKKKPGQGFSVKGPFSEGEITEFMWLEVESIDGEWIKGKLGNEPANMKELRLNDPVKMNISDLNDWVYEGEDGLIGAFTVHAIREIQADQ